MKEHEEIGVILSQSTTQEAVCQLFEEAERGGIREGMLLLVEASPNRRRILGRVAEIIPYNDFFTEGDPWSEARRKKMPLPHEMDKGKDADFGPIQVCPLCGYTLEGDAPHKCPICNTPGEEFKTF